MSIFLVRHGETRWNLEGRYQGRFDSPLTERGFAQAEAIGRRLADMPKAASAEIVTSPLPRARETAEIIRVHGRYAGFRVDDRLREISLGSWDGLTRKQIEARSPGVFNGEGGRAWYFRSPDGESENDFCSRVAAWLREAESAPTRVVVTHGVVSRALRGLYACLPTRVWISLPVPQDALFRLSGGAVEKIPASG